MSHIAERNICLRWEIRQSIADVFGIRGVEDRRWAFLGTVAWQGSSFPLAKMRPQPIQWPPPSEPRSFEFENIALQQQTIVLPGKNERHRLGIYLGQSQSGTIFWALIRQPTKMLLCTWCHEWRSARYWNRTVTPPMFIPRWCKTLLCPHCRGTHYNESMLMRDEFGKEHYISTDDFWEFVKRKPVGQAWLERLAQ